ncbi:hypothetical protein VCHENC02_1643, partial [Vibrio harveyi]
HLAYVPLLLECRLRLVDVFKWESLRDQWFDVALFNMMNQVSKHFRFKDGTTKESEIFEIQSAHI